MNVPNVTRTEYTLMDINDEGYLSLMEDNGKMKEDLKLPYEIDPELSDKIKAMFDEGKNLIIGTIGALGMEMVNAVKEESAGAN
jgi:translation initiation factor 5A